MKKKRWLRSTVSFVLIAVMCLGLTLSGNLGRVFAEDTEISLLNGDFGKYLWGDEKGWDVAVTPTWDNTTVSNSHEEGEGDSKQIIVDGKLNFWRQEAGEIVLTQSVELEAGTYLLGVEVIDGASAAISLLFGSEIGTSIAISSTGVQSNEFTLADAGSVEIGVRIAVEAGGWGYIDNISLKKVDTTESTEEGTEEGTESTEEGTESTEEGTEEQDPAGNGVVYEDDMESAVDASWTVTWENATDGKSERKADQWASNNTTIVWKLESPSAQKVVITREVSVGAGKYTASVESDGGDIESGKIVISDGTTSKEAAMGFEGWDNWTTATTGVLEVADDVQITLTIEVDLKAGGWFDLDNVKVATAPEAADFSELKALIATVPANYEIDGFKPETVTALKEALAAAEACTEATESATIDNCYKNLQAALNALVYSDSTVIVKKVDNLSDDFMKGVDISTYISEINSGVVYRDWSGNPVDGVGFIKLLADSGVNYIRLRVWNAPYVVNADGTPAKDASGKIKWYGGGNNDINTTKEICNLIAEYNQTYNGNVKVLIDFHYSDFWADPDKQTIPKEWKDITDINVLKEKVKEYTKASLTAIAETGVPIGMVQVGNETNNGICGQKGENYYEIFKAGCEAVKEYDPNILRAVHYTDPHQEDKALTYANELIKRGVDFDVYATSYYPFWHGTPETLTKELNKVAALGKQVVVAETQYPYTNADYDGSDNQAYEGKDNIELSGWPVSVQGQTNEIRDVIEAVAKVSDNKGIGFFYWEPAWLGVGNAYDANGNLDDAKLAANREKWNTFGSGWASDYAAEYDPSAAQWGGGGTNNENASLLDFDGTPHSSLNVFKYVNYGAEAPLSFYRADSIEDKTVLIGATVEELKSMLPVSVGYTYNDLKTKGTADITWNENRLKEVEAELTKNTAVGLSLLIDGTITVDGESHTVRVAVAAEPRENLLVNGAFEEKDSGWNVGPGILYYSGDNPRNGSNQAITINTYSDAVKGLTPDANGCYAGSISQTVENLPAGVYEARVYFEGLSGAGSREGEYLNISAKCGDQTLTSENVVLTGWMEWKPAVVTNITITEEMVKAGTNSITLYANASVVADTWGSLDDFYLYRIGDAPKSDDTGNTTPPTTPSGDTPTTVTDKPQYNGWVGVSAEQKAKLMQESLAQNAAVIAPKTNDNAPLTMAIVLLMTGAVAVAGAVGKKRRLS